MKYKNLYFFLPGYLTAQVWWRCSVGDACKKGKCSAGWWFELLLGLVFRA